MRHSLHLLEDSTLSGIALKFSRALRFAHTALKLRRGTWCVFGASGFGGVFSILHSVLLNWSSLGAGMELKIPEFYIDAHWPPDDYAPFLSEIGRIVFSWNESERIVRQITYNMAGGGEGPAILAVHMGTSSLLDAARTYANRHYSDERKEHLLHAIKLFERLREYRNYIVHSFNQVLCVGNGIPAAIGMQQYRAKGSYVIEESQYNLSQIRAIAKVFSGANKYFTHLHNHIVPYALKNRPLEQLLPLPEKFPLPDRLPKSRRDLQVDKPPPAPSQT